jgi:hypothetical protein
MFNDRNLLDVENPYDVKYITNLMSILFTKDEMMNGLIKTKLSRSLKKDLDPVRVKLLRGK